MSKAIKLHSNFSLFLVGAEVSESCVIKHSIWRFFGNVLGHCDADGFCLLFNLISLRVARSLGWESLNQSIFSKWQLWDFNWLSRAQMSDKSSHEIVNCTARLCWSEPSQPASEWNMCYQSITRRVHSFSIGHLCVFRREPSGHRELIWHAATADGTFYSLYGLFTLILISICVT